jgi:hypothetical protein
MLLKMPKSVNRSRLRNALRVRAGANRFDLRSPERFPLRQNSRPRRNFFRPAPEQRRELCQPLHGLEHLGCAGLAIKNIDRLRAKNIVSFDPDQQGTKIARF